MGYLPIILMFCVFLHSVKANVNDKLENRIVGRVDSMGNIVLDDPDKIRDIDYEERRFVHFEYDPRDSWIQGEISLWALEPFFDISEEDANEILNQPFIDAVQVERNAFEVGWNNLVTENILSVSNAIEGFWNNLDKENMIRNYFRYGTGIARLLAVLILLAQIVRTKSCSGISARTQVLFCLMYITRYLDTFTVDYSTCNHTYEPETHVCRAEVLIIASAILALMVHQVFTVVEVLWTFSYYLESVAILPQIFMLHSTGSAETITPLYILALASSRVLYIIHGILNYTIEEKYQTIMAISRIVQTVLYAYFFVLYIIRAVKKSKQSKQ